MKKNYGEFEKIKKGKSSEIRKLVIQEEFKEYQKNIILLNKLEKKILKLDEIIYGDIGDIYILPRFTSYSAAKVNYLNFILSIKDKTITFNQKELINIRKSNHEYKLKKYNLSDVGLDHEEIIYTIRKLSKLKNDTIRAEILDYISRNMNIKVKDISELMYNNYKLSNRDCKEIMYRKYDLDNFFELLLGYIDIIDMALLDIGFEELKTQTVEYISNIERISSKITSRYNLPSNSEFIKNVKEKGLLGKGNTIRCITSIINTIDKQLEDIKCKLQSYPEYLSLKDEYTKLLAKVENFENKFFN